MSPQHRHITPVPRRAADGPVAAVYEQSADELGRVAFMMLSPAPDLMAATWALLRESLLVGQVSRAAKEVVATAVSLANECPFCVDAHTIFLHATGAHDLAEAIRNGEPLPKPESARLVAWADATRTSGAAELSAPPYRPEHASEYIGTALAFHFVNRTISALWAPDLLPGGLQDTRAVRRLGARWLARTVHRRRQAGTALSLIGDLPFGEPPAWAGGSPIGVAYAALRTAAMAGGAHLTEPGRSAVLDAVEEWDGEHPPTSGGWWREALSDVRPAERPAAKLAMLAALAPYRITDGDIETWREIEPGDAALVRLIAFGAMTAVEHSEAAIVAASAAASA